MNPNPMIEIKQINTGVAELLAVKVPEGATKFFVHPFMNILGFTKEDGSSGFIEFDQPLTGPWELLGNHTELTEEQCREVVEPMVYGMHRLGKGFKNYSLNKPEHHPPYVYTAQKAFASLMQANGCYSVNPYGKKAPKYNVSKSDGSATRYLEWKKAEASTGTWLILVRK